MPPDVALQRYIREVPKAELHLHIEGTLEPEQMFLFARRNNVPVKYASVEEDRQFFLRKRGFELTR